MWAHLDQFETFFSIFFSDMSSTPSTILLMTPLEIRNLKIPQESWPGDGNSAEYQQETGGSWFHTRVRTAGRVKLRRWLTAIKNDTAVCARSGDRTKSLS